jgi:hypothetical protein
MLCTEEQILFSLFLLRSKQNGAKTLAGAISNNVHKKFPHKVFQVGKPYRALHYRSFLEPSWLLEERGDQLFGGQQVEKETVTELLMSLTIFYWLDKKCYSIDLLQLFFKEQRHSYRVYTHYDTGPLLVNVSYK